MSAPRLYIAVSLEAGQTLQLPGPAAHHLTRVLRRQQGDALILFNGNGYEYPAQLISAGKKEVLVKLASEAFDCSDRESPLMIHVGLSLTKGQKMDIAIQKLVELGVTEITPIMTQRSVVKLDDKREQSRLDHWLRIIVSACEQSGRCIIPLLHTVKSLQEWAASLDASVVSRLTLDPQSAQSIRVVAPQDSVALAIGPEGGFAQEEVAALGNVYFKPVKLGNRVLRAETAPLAAVAALQTLHGDFA